MGKRVEAEIGMLVDSGETYNDVQESNGDP